MDMINNINFNNLVEENRMLENLPICGSLFLGGSWAYGLNNENSDFDIRGFVLSPLESILLQKPFEQFVDSEHDITIYSLHKFIKLLTDCNPNIIEFLGLLDGHILYDRCFGDDDYGLSAMLRKKENVSLFLSKRAGRTFGGYAYQQLNRLKNNQARFTMDEKGINNHIVDHAKRQLVIKDTDIKSLDLFVDNDSNIILDGCIKNMKFNDVYEYVVQVKDSMKNFNKVGARNHKKDDAHLGKHMCHLIRLYRMGKEILETGTVNTYRRKDRQELLDIRNGKYIKDGIITNEFWELNEYEKNEFDKAFDNSELPESPDIKKIDNMMFNFYKTVYSRMMNEI